MTPPRPEPGLGRCHLLAVALLVPLSAADLVTTFLAIDRGASEANPIAAAFLGNPPVAVAVKVLVPLAVFLAAVVAREHTPRLVAASWAVVGFYAAVVLSNALHAMSNV